MKAILIIGAIFFTYSMFMIWQTARYFYIKSKPTRSKLLDRLQAFCELYRLKFNIQVKRVEARKVEFIEVEEVKEIDTPEKWKRNEPKKLEWSVENVKRLGEIIPYTELIE
jgi:hypothetical protein